jgi:hypothetical protein
VNQNAIPAAISGHLANEIHGRGRGRDDMGKEPDYHHND